MTCSQLPRAASAGLVTDTPTAFWDVMPTLADLLQLNTTDLPADIDGVSMAQAWLGQPTRGACPLFSPLLRVFAAEG
jgi:arylsulfatase A-like enzyme